MNPEMERAHRAFTPSMESSTAATDLTWSISSLWLTVHGYPNITKNNVGCSFVSVSVPQTKMPQTTSSNEHDITNMHLTYQHKL